MPAGATANVSGNSITVSTTTGVAAGSYVFTIQGTDGIRTHTATATLVVSAPTFTMSFTPSTATAARPSGNATMIVTYQVTINPVGGFRGTVNLTAKGGSTGVSLDLSPASITPGVTATLTATVTSSAKKGNQSLTVTGTSGSVTQSASATLKIN